MLKNKALRSLFSVAMNYKTRRQYSLENTNIGSQVNEIKPQIQSNILSLQQFIIERNKNKPIALFESRSNQIFVFGMNPLILRNRLFVFFKYNYWQKNMYGEERLLQFCTKVKQEQLKLRNFEQDKKDEQYYKRLKLVQEYQRQIVTLNFLQISEQIQFSEHYIHILSIFLDRVDKLTQFQMYFIFDNLQRIVVGELNEKQNQSTKDLGWLLVQAFDKFVNKIDCYLNSLSTHYKSLLISLAKSLRSSNVRLLQYIKITLQNDKKQLTMHYFLSGLCLLAINNTFPYEYFYKNKQDIMNYLQSAQNLSSKKVLNTISMLQIFSRKRLMYCEKIIDRLLICIEENLTACDITQVSKIFFYYSKLKCSIKNNLVAKIVERIYLFMDILDEKTYSFIIKAISNLNYQDNTLIQALKYYNYQLFLSIIKYNSENSGDFYRKIIEQVEHAFKADSSRYFSQQDQKFTEKVLTQEVSVVSSKESSQTSINLQT